MIVQEVTQIGSPILHKKAKPIKNFEWKDVKKTIEDLVDTMRQNNLIGMAAPQIGSNIRIFVTELRETKHRKGKDIDPLRIFINPKITKKSKTEETMYESCWSVAYTKIFWPVKRPKEITIEAYNEKGKKFILKATELLARVIQHEFDHIEWITFIEKVADNKKLMSANEYIKKFVEKK